MTNEANERLDAQISHYFSISRYGQVRQLISECLKTDPEEAWYYFMLAMCDYRENNYTEALNYLKQALEFGYNPGKVSEYFGFIYMETDQFVKSETSFLEALRENPENASAHAGYAYLMGKTGFYEKSDLLIDEAMRLDHTDETVLRFKHLLSISKGDKNEQNTAMSQLLEMSSSDIDVHLQLGTEAIHREDIHGAYKHFRAAFVLDPTNEEVLKALKILEPEVHFLKAPLLFMDRYGGILLWHWIILFSIVGLGLLLGEESDVYLGLFLIAYLFYRFTVDFWIKLLLKFRR